MIELRDYQKEMIGGVYKAIRDGKKRILLIALMGLGKTVLSGWIMRDATSRGKRCLFLVPLTVLIDQTIETLEALGVHCSALQGDRHYDPTALVTVASLQTIASRLRSGQSLQDILGEKHLLFADEAHVTAFDTVYPELENFVLGNGGVCIGMTATPWRLSKKQWLGQKYDRAIEGHTWLEYHLMLEFGTSDFSQLFQRDWRAVLGVPYAANWEQVKRSYIAKIKALTEADYVLAQELNAALEDARDDRIDDAA